MAFSYYSCQTNIWFLVISKCVELLFQSMFAEISYGLMAETLRMQCSGKNNNILILGRVET